MLGSPGHTAYDLNFRFLGIPVRVHPLFWLVMIMISSGGGRGSNELLGAVVFCACAFVSVLVHELGHGLSSRLMGDEPMGIVLYAFGGFCQIRLDMLAPWKRLVVLLMGPGAGFLLLLLVLAGLKASYDIQPLDAIALVGLPVGDPVLAIVNLPRSLAVRFAVLWMIEINLWWGLLNLLPLWPLDGGRINEVFLSAVNPRSGRRWGHVVSLLLGAVLAMWRASVEDWSMAIWFGIFAAVNYQMLQAQYRAFQEGWWDG